MRRKTSIFHAAGIVLCFLCLNLLRHADGCSDDRHDSAEAKAPPKLPGPQPGGETLLPMQWSLKPAGSQLIVGDFPVNIVLHPHEPFAAVMHSGYGEHEIVIVDLKTRKIASRTKIPQGFYGLCFDPEGKRLFASGGETQFVHQFSFSAGTLAGHHEISAADPPQKGVVSGMSCGRDGKTLYVANAWADQVALISLDHPNVLREGEAPAEPGNSPDTPSTNSARQEPRPPEAARDGSAVKEFISLDKDSYPYTVLLSDDQSRLYVSLWGKSAVAVVDLKTKRIQATWPTQSHPTEMALSPKNDLLYVACANANSVTVLDTSNGNAVETIGTALYPNAPNGSTPNSLALSADGKVLLVANADNNNVAVIDVYEKGQSKPLGFIPTGWYPTSVRFDRGGGRILVANGKGLGSRNNPDGPNPLVRRQPVRQYIGDLFPGVLSVVAAPSPEEMAAYTKTAYACSPLRKDLQPRTAPGQAGNPIPAKVGGPSPIKHCIYIIKENRTYDQIFGDMPEGNGDRKLCIFPEKVTPNLHALRGSSCSWTTFTSIAKSAPTATSGRPPPTPRTSWKRAGRSIIGGGISAPSNIRPRAISKSPIPRAVISGIAVSRPV